MEYKELKHRIRRIVHIWDNTLFHRSYTGKFFWDNIKHDPYDYFAYCNGCGKIAKAATFEKECESNFGTKHRTEHCEERFGENRYVDLLRPHCEENIEIETLVNPPYVHEFDAMSPEEQARTMERMQKAVHAYLEAAPIREAERKAKWEAERPAREAARKAEQEAREAKRRSEEFWEEVEYNRTHPMCPTCHSRNTHKIGGFVRAASADLAGLASPYIGKTFECNNCGYTW